MGMRSWIVLVLIVIGSLSGTVIARHASNPSTTFLEFNLIGASGQTYSCSDDNYNKQQH